ARRHATAAGRNFSPPLVWPDPPAGTQHWALICEDPDAPRGTFTHWVLFNLPAAVRSLPEEVPAETKLANGGLQGVNDFGKVGYGGAGPPRGKPHRHPFKLFAPARAPGPPPGRPHGPGVPTEKSQGLGAGGLGGADR